jgi:hypothetical protein
MKQKKRFWRCRNNLHNKKETLSITASASSVLLTECCVYYCFPKRHYVKCRGSVLRKDFS